MKFEKNSIKKNTFMTVRLILWKSDNPVLITSDFWKDFGLYVIIKSIQVGFMEFLKKVSSLTIFLQPYIWQKCFIVASLGSTLKSPIRKKFSNYSSCESRFLSVQFKWLAITFFWGLQELQRSHVFFLNLVSTKNPSIDKSEFSNVEGIPSLIYNRRMSPPFAFLSNLHGVA